MNFSGKGLRILDFDIENRPLSYLGMDFTTSEITAIAWGWVGAKRITTRCLGVTCQHPGCSEVHHGVSGEQILTEFVEVYDRADMLTGHNIIKHDLPIINGALMEAGMEPLHDKLVHDTYLMLKKGKGISRSQENLCKTLGVEAPKIHMDTPLWREANRLTPDGIRLTHKRCAGDVYQHRLMREELIRRRWLKQPVMWKSSGFLEATA